MDLRRGRWNAIGIPVLTSWPAPAALDEVGTRSGPRFLPNNAEEWTREELGFEITHRDAGHPVDGGHSKTGV